MGKTRYTVRRRFSEAQDAKEVWGSNLGYDPDSKTSIPGTGVVVDGEVFTNATLLFDPSQVENNRPVDGAQPLGVMTLEFIKL